MNRDNGERAAQVRLRLILHVFSLCSGVVLMVSSLAHWKNPYAFLQAVLLYEWVWGSWATAVAMSLPALQLVVGTCIVLNLSRPLFLWVAGGLFTIFAVVQASALWRGLEISCGCFSVSSGGPMVSLWTFGGVAVLACFAFAATKLNRILVDRMIPNE